MDKVQSFIKSGNVSSSTDTELRTLSNRKQNMHPPQPATAQSEMEEIRVASTELPTMTSFNSPYGSSLRSLHRGRSYERLTTVTDSIFQDQNGYVSDSSLPSERQSIARRQDFPNESDETTPLIQQHSPTDGVEEMEKVFDEDKETVSFSSNKSEERRKHLLVRYGKHSKVIILFLVMLASVALFATKEDEKAEMGIVAINSDYGHNQHYDLKEPHYRILMTLTGPFEDKKVTKGKVCTSGCIRVCSQTAPYRNDTDKCHNVTVFPRNHVVDNGSIELEFHFKKKLDSLNFTYTTDIPDIVPFTTTFEGFEVSLNVQVAIAAIILVFVYIFIVFDLVHRVVAALIGSTIAVAMQTILSHRPTLGQVIDHIQFDTICLLFGMMILVAIFSQTGFFDYAAVKMYKMARGKIWTLMFLLCLFSGVVSAFIDNVTTILLLTPVSIRLCQVLNLDPRYVLIAEVVFSNIGGTGTAIGDPPNIIIVSHKDIKDAGINFPEFTLHLAIGIVFCMIIGFVLIRLLYWRLSLKNKDPPEVAELKREIAIWKRTARHMRVVSLEERGVRDRLLMKAQEVQAQLRDQLSHNAQTSTDIWRKNLESLEEKYKITDKVLLTKSSIVLAVVILSFFLLHTIPNVHIDLGWIALFGSMILLILADVEELDAVLEKVEWATLLFFAGLFILMETLAELGLINYIGARTVDLVEMVSPENQLLVAILVVVWVSALASSFIDNIPFTTAMIPVIVELANDESICVPLKPLVWSLAFGACLGGNGTLIGASANVVCAGLAEQNGYPISFVLFFKIGFPMMLGTTFVATVYLVICHVALGWDGDACIESHNGSSAVFF